jgi:hypothetical protein
MLIFYTIISSNYYYINYKYMLVQDDVRNSVIHLIAKRRRDGENQKWAFKKTTCATHLQKS